MNVVKMIYLICNNHRRLIAILFSSPKPLGELIVRSATYPAYIIHLLASFSQSSDMKLLGQNFNNVTSMYINLLHGG